MTSFLDSQPDDAVVDAYYTGMARFWHPVLVAADLADAPLRVELLGRALTVVRLGGEVRCLDDLCRHLGASLAQGEVVDGVVLRCAYHGWSYDGTGRCVDIPARRNVPIPTGARVQSFPAVERYGLVWVCLDESAGTDVPAFPEYDDPAFRIAPLIRYEPWRASAPRMVMAALDDTHFPWVHPGLLGDRDHPEPPEHTAHRDGQYVVAEYSRLQRAAAKPDDARSEADSVLAERVSRCTPSSIHFAKRVEDETFVIFEAVQPITYNVSISYVYVARNYDLDPARDQTYVDFQNLVKSQDQPVVESQRPWILPPMSAKLLLYVRPADIPLIEYQRMLEAAGIPQL